MPQRDEIPLTGFRAEKKERNVASLGSLDSGIQDWIMEIREIKARKSSVNALTLH